MTTFWLGSKAWAESQEKYDYFRYTFCLERLEAKFCPRQALQSPSEDGKKSEHADIPTQYTALVASSVFPER